MSIKAKLIFISVLNFLILVGILTYAHLAIQQSSQAVSAVYERPMMSSNFARDIFVQFHKIAGHQKEASLNSDVITDHYATINESNQILLTAGIAAVLIAMASSLYLLLSLLSLFVSASLLPAKMLEKWVA